MVLEELGKGKGREYSCGVFVEEHYERSVRARSVMKD